MNSASFDEFGRMTANLGVEAVPATPGRTERHPVPVRQPADRDHRRAPTCPGRRRQRDADLDGDRRDADLEDHPQRRGHPPDPLPPLRRAGAQPGHLGQHHHPARPTELGWKDTVRMSPLEDTIVALRPIIPDAPVRDPEQHPAAEPDDAARRHHRVQQRRRATATRTRRRSPTSSSTSAGSTCTTATS